MQVSVRELKIHLSHYLHLVSEGEALVVTSHNKPVATLAAIPAVGTPGLQRLLQTGKAKWNGKKPIGGTGRPAIHGTTLSDTVLKERG
jgi:prevent-host-death family protein